MADRILRFRQPRHANKLARSKQVLRGYEHTATTAKTGMRGHHTRDSHKRGHEMSGVLELLPHDMDLRVELDTNETYYLKSGWIGCCDGIYGLAVSYTDGSGIGPVSFLGDPAPIVIMNSHVKLAVPFDDHENQNHQAKRGCEMSRAIRYVECAHCGETVCTCYVTCPYCGYRLAVHSPPPRGEMCELTQITTD